MFNRWIDYFTIIKSGYFDPAYYLLTYPDCRRADVNPLWHFVTCGWKEGRNPSLEFDTAYYLQANSDVKQAGINPLVHYLKHGQREGRIPRPYRASQRVAARRVELPNSLRRMIYKTGKTLYWAIPFKHRQKLLTWAYQNIGSVFRGTPHYENWRNYRTYIPISTQANLIDLQFVPAATEATGSIAIHVHIFYQDLIKEFAGYLKNMPFPYDLYVSVTNEQAADASRHAFSGLPLCRKIKIESVLNRGRDLAPMFCTFRDELASYDFICHLHGKKSLYNQGATQGWREYLCTNLIGSPERVRRIFGLMQGDEPSGIVYPQNYIYLPYWANSWLANRSLGEVWCARLGIRNVPRGYFDFPASSMFWARGDALAPLFNAGISIDDFPEETGQTDGTLAHTLERLVVLCALTQEKSPAIIRDEEYPSWSPWRFDQYINRTYQNLVTTLNAPNINLIGFDIFDTLMCRPLLNPESIKRIVARRVGNETGQLYERFRAVAEQQAREARDGDVGLDEIYKHLGELAKFPTTELTELKHAEEQVEKESLEPRDDVIRLFTEALTTQKPVILITDMFLQHSILEDILHTHKIEGWNALFVSNEVGLRKDSGKLYEHILTKYAVEPSRMLMIGDNERSDIQIPTDMGANVISLLRPIELARGLPRFSPLIAAHEHKEDLDAEITLGLVVRKNFAPIHYPNFDPDSLVQVTPFNLGYSLVGPLLLSFADWLYQQAQTDGITRLYFLAREGKPIKAIFDYWCEDKENVPKSDYLVVSRRAAGLAAISTLDDILNIAKTTYFPNTIEKFLHTRYGIRLTDERWYEVERSAQIGRGAVVSVQNRRIETLIPLLTDLEADILSQVQRERVALLRYLEDEGLCADDRQAVVDIGYSGSVQGYLNQLLTQKVHGYYLMTTERSRRVAETYNVLLRGCFYENVTSASNTPAMFTNSFNVEKLLSTNEAQIEHYALDERGNPAGHFRDFLPEELTGAEIRDQILAGALGYAQDARKVRAAMLPDFQPSRWTAQALMEAFLGQKSTEETSLLSKIVLDDYYCGRDLVI